MNENNLNQPNIDLRNQNWSDTLQAKNVNVAYEYFINNVKNSFERNCPLQRIKSKQLNNKPWLTRGLLNACKKQKSLQVFFA